MPLLAALLLAGSAAAAPSPKMPLTGLALAVLVPGLCPYSYPVSTSSAKCQAYCDQALAYHYSYVYLEAARSFETALALDPECAFAWLGLARAYDKWGKNPPANANPLFALAGAAVQPGLPPRFGKPVKEFALSEAQRLMPKANAREQLLIRAKLQEKGIWLSTPADEKRKRAAQTLDELLTLYDDDQEAWFARAQVADGAYGPAPFYKALLQRNPLHPGANHELVHFYEGIRRPALGWPFAEKYVASSPKIAHAYHMQAHLGTRIGKWKQTTDWSFAAAELEREYHRVQGIAAAEDDQYPHHLDVLTRCLIHDGRLAEARATRDEAKRHGYAHRAEWFKLALAGREWGDAEALVKETRKADKFNGAYYAALLALERGDLTAARAEVETLRQQVQSKAATGSSETKLWEVQGRLLCATGDGEAGVKLLKRTVAKTKDDFGHHAWGNGAYYMEAWGMAALDAGLAAEAEEAFLEALAHDAGSVRGALGLHALCARLGRTQEAGRYAEIAAKAWAKAAPSDFDALRTRTIERAKNVPTDTLAGAE